jgi:hypothetical protein
VDSSFQEEAPKKKPRSYKEALTRPTVQLDVVSTSKSKPTKKSRDWNFPPGRGEATRNKVAAMDKRDAAAAAAEKKAVRQHRECQKQSFQAKETAQSRFMAIMSPGQSS